MNDQKNNLNNIFSEIKDIVSDINYKVGVQNKKIEALENKIAALESRGKDTVLEHKSVYNIPRPPTPPKAPAHEVNPAKRGVESFADKLSSVMKIEDYSEEKKSSSYPGKEPTLPTPQVKSAETKEESSSLEEKIGGRWFAKIGMIVFVLGISFFLKYAFDNNWIGETGRVLLGVFIGLGFLAFGEKTIRKYFAYGQVITGGGLVILYLSIYAAQNFYSLINQTGAFAFMSLITLAGIALSLRYNAPALIIASTFGGFAVPFLTSTGKNNLHGLFSYILLLDLSVLAVSVFKKWRWLNLVGMIGTLIIFSSWAGTFYTKDQLWPVMFYLTAFFIVYSISSLAYNLFKKENSGGIEQLMTLATGIVYFAVSYSLLDQKYSDFMGYFAFVLAFYYFILAYIVRYLTPKDESLYNFLAFFSVGFLTIAIPLQFKEFSITILWLIESVLLYYASLKVGGNSGRVLKIFASLVFSLSIIKVLFSDQCLYEKTDRLLLNKVFITSLVAVLSCYLLSYMFKRLGKDKEEENIFLNTRIMASAFLLLASFLTVYGVTRDVIYFNKHQVAQEYARVAAANEEIYERYGRYDGVLEKVNLEKINGLYERMQATISVFWLLYAVAIIVYGIYRKEKDLIRFGLILNFLVIVKLMLYDLWEFDKVARPIVSFFTIITAYLSAVIFYEYGKKETEDKVFGGGKKLMLFFLVAANILTIFAVSREIYLVFEKQKDNMQQEITKACARSYSKFDKFSLIPGMDNNNTKECDELRAKAKSLENKASIAISLFWLFYAILLITVGFVKRFKWVRIGGIALLTVAIIKLFIVDLWSLGQLYRIIAFTSLGLVLLGVSYFYQKHKDIFKEIIK